MKYTIFFQKHIESDIRSVYYKDYNLSKEDECKKHKKLFCTSHKVKYELHLLSNISTLDF